MDQKVNNKIVFTNGCFDILHVGHVDYLNRSAQLGNFLLVAVNSDESIRRLEKGANRPMHGSNQCGLPLDWCLTGGVRLPAAALRLPLAKAERGCLDDLCLACGF